MTSWLGACHRGGIGLDVWTSTRPGAPPAAAGELRQQLEGPLLGAEVRQREPVSAHTTAARRRRGRRGPSRPSGADRMASRPRGVAERLDAAPLPGDVRVESSGRAGHVAGELSLGHCARHRCAQARRRATQSRPGTGPIPSPQYIRRRRGGGGERTEQFRAAEREPARLQVDRGATPRRLSKRMARPAGLQVRRRLEQRGWRASTSRARSPVDRRQRQRGPIGRGATGSGRSRLGGQRRRRAEMARRLEARPTWATVTRRRSESILPLERAVVLLVDDDQADPAIGENTAERAPTTIRASPRAI